MRVGEVRYFPHLRSDQTSQPIVYCPLTTLITCNRALCSPNSSTYRSCRMIAVSSLFSSLNKIIYIHCPILPVLAIFSSRLILTRSLSFLYHSYFLSLSTYYPQTLGALFFPTFSRSTPHFASDRTSGGGRSSAAVSHIVANERRTDNCSGA